MGSYLIPPPVKRRVPRLYSVAAVVLAVAVLAVARGADPGVTISVNGGEAIVRSGTTVGALIDAGVLELEPGDLVCAADGEILEAGGGGGPVVLRNGLETTRTVRVWDGDALDVVRGADVVESTQTTQVVIPFEARVEGKGPFVSLSSPGAAGMKEVVVGEISGREVTSTVVQEAVPMVVTRYRPSPGDKVVALTFDDGPWPATTAATLDILATYEVPATFFLIGRQIDRHADLVKRMVDEGHLIGNHTQNHPRLTTVAPEKVRAEIASAQQAATRVAGVTPEWFRPPGGHFNGLVWDEAEAQKMRFALWDVDPQDWRRPGADVIAARVIGAVRPGSIVLLHDGGGDRAQTVQALPAIIKGLRAAGYTFVTLEDLAQ